MIYLAGPIDLANIDQGIKSKLSRALRDRQELVFDPSISYGTPEQMDAEHLRSIGAVNRAALSNSELLLALLPTNKPTWGTPVEIEYALQDGKLVLIVSDVKAANSVQMQDWVDRGAIVVRALFQVPGGHEHITNLAYNMLCQRRGEDTCAS